MTTATAPEVRNGPISGRAPAARIRSTERCAEWQVAVETIDRGLFKRHYWQVKLRDLSSVWPLDDFRQTVQYLVGRWIRDYEAKGYRLLTPSGDILVSGPFKPRDQAAMIANSPKSMRAVARSESDDPFQDTAWVAFQAEFLIPHTYLNDRWEVEG